MRARAVVLAMLILTTGCLGAGDPDAESRDDEDDSPPEQRSTRTFEREIVYEGEVTAGAEDRAVDVGGSTILGAGLDSVSVDLSWQRVTNDFQAHVQPPAGEEVIVASDAPIGTEASAEIDDVEPGLWRFSVSVEGSHVPDEVRLEITALWVLSTTDVRVEAGAANTSVQTEQRGDDWFAWQERYENDTVGQTVRATVDATNGPINLSAGTPPNGDEAGFGDTDRQDAEGHLAYVRVLSWARADTESEALERVRSIDVSITIDEDTVQVGTDAPSWEHRGTDVDVLLPSDVQVTPSLDTTNGGVSLQAADVLDADLDTTNGPVQANIGASGNLRLDTTNGPIYAAIFPTSDAELEVDTTNGPAQLQLHEASHIGYIVDAETTNGQITESMDEAELEGSSDEATLRTEQADSRDVQVTGSVDTTNGNIHFQGG